MQSKIQAVSSLHRGDEIVSFTCKTIVSLIIQLRKKEISHEENQDTIDEEHKKLIIFCLLYIEAPESNDPGVMDTPHHQGEGDPHPTLAG